MLHLQLDTFIIAGTYTYECIRKFWNSSQGKGDCLEDEPADNSYAYPDLPPGAMYDAEHQCRLQFGVREASVCLTSASLHEVNKGHQWQIADINLATRVTRFK